MVNKYFRIVVFLLLTISLSFALGCSEEPALNISAEIISVIWQENSEGKNQIITSNSQLIAYSQERNLVAFDNSSLIVLKNYDDSFFERNALLVLEIEEGISNSQVMVKSYSCENETIKIYVESHNTSELSKPSMVRWVILLSLTKEEVKSITNVSLFKNGSQVN
mgnify:CR=1 FL=1